jgi:mono/diheme cytochrome c family protein
MTPTDSRPHRWPLPVVLLGGAGVWVAICLASLAGRPLSAATGPAALDFARDVKPFFADHCVRCHGPEKQKGDFRIDTLERDFVKTGTATHWTEVMDRINTGEMPPKKEPRPAVEQSSRAAEWIAAQLAEAEVARQAALGEKVSFRRLSREEYRNTIRDLLGVTYDASDPTGLPEDPDWQGFERIGSVLTLSATHVEKYLAAAEASLNEALALGPQPEVQHLRWTGAEMRVGGNLTNELRTRGLLDKIRGDLVPNNGALDARSLDTYVAGDFICRMKLSGLRPPGGRAARLRLYATDLGRTLFEQDIDAPEDAPVTLEFRTHLPPGGHLIRVVNAVPGPNPEERASRPLNSKPFFRMSQRQPWQIKLTDDDGVPLRPTLLIDWIEWTGPIHDTWPSATHQRLFFGGETATKDLGYAREVLTRFAGRAFRRPAAAAEIDRLVKLVEESQKLGDNFEASVKTGLLAVLCSNSFLYLVEGSTAAPSPRLTDYELASRLSYFLWSTMPDDRLLDLAKQGKLHEAAVLRAEAQRMLRDPKALAFADSFPRQWLQLKRVGMFAPDRKLYPEYDEYLEKSMVAETTGFFREVMQGNLSIRNFLDSDWTMLNERLADHYGIANVHGETPQRYPLKPEDHRGGLLTQASILGLTSDGTRHRPVHRGKWVLESIYGTPPPPPPPNVTALKPATPAEPKSSLRAKIENHRSDANCASCHRKIDPLGLAFENYDAIGHWRTEEDVRDGSGANPTLDPSGSLPDGREFADAGGLKRLMVADLDKFAAAFTTKLATYGMRRAMTFDDRKSLAAVAAQGKADDYALATMIEHLVASDLFQKR